MKCQTVKAVVKGRLSMHIRKRSIAVVLVFLMGMLGALACLVWYSRVTCRITPEDRVFIAAFLKEGQMENLRPGAAYVDELSFIQGAQKAVLHRAPGNEPVPMYHPREPKDVYLFRSGLCYDRSRVMEKILKSRGFATRHVSVYASGKCVLASLILPKTASHAVLEVCTRKGWLVVDSNRPWVSTDKNGNPVSMARMKQDAGKARIPWLNQGAVHSDPIFQEPFVYIYGLYSRHGKFYPPYTPFPDICWQEFADNFF